MKICQKHMDAGAYSRFDIRIPVQQTQSSTMPMQTLGRILFPRLQPWQQKRQAKTVVTVLVVAVVFAAVVGVIIFMSNRAR